MGNDVSFVGYEISPFAFELCKQREKDRLHYKMRNLFEDNEALFDIAMAIDVFEHIEDYFGFLRNFSQKGTYKIFHIPLELSVLGLLRIKGILKNRQSVGHIHHFTKDTALATLEELGYEIIDYFYTPAVDDFRTKTIKNILIMLIRKMCFKLNRNLSVRIWGGYSLMVLTK
jgi:hypothetical protein